MDFQTISAIVFLVLLGLFLFFRRRNVHLQKLLFPLLYVVLYRTKLGLPQMDRWAARFPRLVRGFGYFSVVIGFLGMAVICIMLLHSLYAFLTAPAAAPGVSLVLPFKAKGTFYVPFFYWIITIFIIAVVHEFCHGLLARAHRIPLKSSGFAFLAAVIPVLPAAFVEPNEKVLGKQKAMAQLSVFAAGPVSNLVTAALAILLTLAISPVSNALFLPTGVTVNNLANMSDGSKYPAELSGILPGDRITHIDGVPVQRVKAFSQTLAAHKPGDRITLATNRSTHTFALAENPADPEKPYAGVFVTQAAERNADILAQYGALPFTLTEWTSDLLFWLYALSLGIGLFNLLPLGPIDGGRMLKTALQSFFHEQRAHHIWKWTSVFFLALILINLSVGFFR